MKVKCVARTHNLNNEEIYDVIDSDDECYEIVDDWSNSEWYYKDRFEIVEDDNSTPTTNSSDVIPLSEDALLENITVRIPIEILKIYEDISASRNESVTYLLREAILKGVTK